MARPKKIDWASAQKDYIEDTTLTYADIAEKYGVSKNVVGLRAKAEGWIKYRKSIEKKTIQAVEGELIDRNSHINELHINLANGMASLASKHLSIAHRQIDKAEKERGKNNVSLNDKDIISQQRMKALFESIAIAVNIQRVAVGLPTSIAAKQLPVEKPSKTNLFMDDDPEEAAVKAINTAGRAVLFAGSTVCVALLGLLTVGISFLNGVGIAAAIVALSFGEEDFDSFVLKLQYLHFGSCFEALD